jgi:hypothetical protein
MQAWSMFTRVVGLIGGAGWLWFTPPLKDAYDDEILFCLGELQVVVYTCPE